MRILTCLKQVAEPDSQFDLAGGRARLRPSARRKMSSFDEFALEEGLRLKQALPGSQVWALTVGPAEAVAVLQRALGMGADQAAHILAPEEPQPRPASLAAWIAGWARTMSFDLVLAGVMSEDAMQGQVGPLLAHELGLPWATSVVGTQAMEGGRALRVEREMEGGLRQLLEMPLPAVLTIQSSLNRPRYPSLSNLLRAKQTKPLTMEAAGLAAPPEREAVVGAHLPRKTRAGLVLRGSTADKAASLLGLLRERALL